MVKDLMEGGGPPIGSKACLLRYNISLHKRMSAAAMLLLIPAGFVGAVQQHFGFHFIVR